MEFNKLRSVLLFAPDSRIIWNGDSKDILHNGKIDHRELLTEFIALRSTFTQWGIKVTEISNSQINDPQDLSIYNMMYCRDLCWGTPHGIIISRMGKGIRMNEPIHACKALKDEGYQILGEISEPGTFEGADALWLDSKNVIIGVGGRTNLFALKQIQNYLTPFGINVMPVPFVEQKTQHLLGLVQIVGPKRVLIRTELAHNDVIDIFKKNSFEIISILESFEVQKKQAMNIVLHGENSLIMPDDCPETKKLYKSLGFQIVGEIPFRQIRQGAGGIACTVGILEREWTEC